MELKSSAVSLAAVGNVQLREIYRTPRCAHFDSPEAASSATSSSVASTNKSLAQINKTPDADKSD